MLVRNYNFRKGKIMIITREMGTVLSDTTMSSPVYLDVRNAPFKLYGFCEPYRRVPKDVADATSECVSRLSKVSAGGRVRFRTTSDFIVLHGDYVTLGAGNTSALVASSSFDIYFTEDGKQRFRGIYNPSQGEGKSYVESRLKFHNNEMKDVIVYFPLGANLRNVYIGLSEGCEIEFGSEYKYSTPVVFYGSSFVHGGGLRPSSPYTAVLSRRLDCDFVNLGFGGGALAEKSIMEYCASLDMSVFVYDYDHNAPTLEHLEKTHYEGYKIFRVKHPETPVIFASRPDYWTRNYTLEYYTVDDNEKRRALIEANYKRALADGDKNVYFVDGSKMFPENLRDDCTSDGCHPNDLGYYYMANAFEKVLRPLLEK